MADTGLAGEADAERFDEGYFNRFYYSRRTRAVAPLEYLARARLLAATAELHHLKVRRILDLGAGAGYFLRALDAVFPGSRATGVEISDYACSRYGWKQASITDYTASRPYDLVVCNDVVQYLNRADAAQAIERLAELCSGLLYFMVLTREDWTHNCDQSRTDHAVHMRPARWYRSRLSPHFQRLGSGVWLARRAGIPLFALDSD